MQPGLNVVLARVPSALPEHRSWGRRLPGTPFPPLWAQLKLCRGASGGPQIFPEDPDTQGLG